MIPKACTRKNRIPAYQFGPRAEADPTVPFRNRGSSRPATRHRGRPAPQERRCSRRNKPSSAHFSSTRSASLSWEEEQPSQGQRIHGADERQCQDGDDATANDAAARLDRREFAFHEASICLVSSGTWEGTPHCGGGCPAAYRNRPATTGVDPAKLEGVGKCCIGR